MIIRMVCCRRGRAGSASLACGLEADHTHAEGADDEAEAAAVQLGDNGDAF
mgnify:CR=1